MKIFLVSAIEKRLQELQRKLSEIAEIPKILSSTLATVSQTFDKLTTTLPATKPHCHHHYQNGSSCYPLAYDSEQKRKLSYDEDVYDYELSDDDNKDGDSNIDDKFDAKEAYLQLKRYAAKQRMSKDVTPESDYASESNFCQTELTSKDKNDWLTNNDEDNNGFDQGDENITASATASSDEEEDTEKSCDMYEEFNLPLYKTPFEQIISNESDIEEYDDDDVGVDKRDLDVDNDDEDFLTTSFTWNIRNKPKLQLNDTDAVNVEDKDDSVSSLKQDKEQVDDEKINKLQQQQNVLNETSDILCQKLHIKADTPEKDQKLEKLERSWPWADREKIIYKQSTCHLVPHKPLGLIEQRIQLLARRNLLEHINKIKNPQ